MASVKKSKRLQPVLHLAERNKKMSEQALGRARQQLADEEGKLQQLEDYLLEYQADARKQHEQNMQVAALMHVQQFMGRLTGAIEQQRQQVVLSQHMLAKATALWQVANARFKAMESLIERNVRLEAQAEDKQLQKDLDDLLQGRKTSSF